MVNRGGRREAVSEALIRSMSRPTSYAHPVDEIECHETPMVWILLTGNVAYKVRKPLAFGNVLDSTTLEQRRRLCENEVRFNRRLSPHHCLSVVPISGSPESPRLGDADAPFEYAVKMRRLSHRHLSKQPDVEGGLSREWVDDVIMQVVACHEDAQSMGSSGDSEGVLSLRDAIEDEFEWLMKRLDESVDLRRLTYLRTWMAEAFVRLQKVLSKRQRQGYVRDLHSSLRVDVVNRQGACQWQANRVPSHDATCYQDVCSDLAGLLVDLEVRNERHMARHALNRYLELSGDHELARVLTFFKVYRALERARHACQHELENDANETCRAFLELAEDDCEFQFPYLLIGVGVSGSGKSRFTGETIRRVGGIRLRSAVERQRLIEEERRGDQERYIPEVTERTYRRLASLSGILLESGLPVCIDATCLKRRQRDLLAWQAEGRGLPVILVSFEADTTTLRARIAKRVGPGDDARVAGLSVLDRQLADMDAFDDDERRRLIHLDTTADDATDTLVGLIQGHMRLD